MTSCFVSLCRIFPCFFSDRISATWVLFVFGPPVGQGLLIHEVSRSHTKMHHSRKDSSGRVISSSQRPLPDNTQSSQQTDIAPVRFEPPISAEERPQNYALDRAATGSGTKRGYDYAVKRWDASDACSMNVTLETSIKNWDRNNRRTTRA